MDGSKAPEIEARIARAVARFAGVVGPAWARSDPAELGDYHDPFHFGNRQDHAPSAVVSPASVEQVQAILRIANEERVPLWTVSQGKNLGYGGAAPALPGSIVLELKRMNRILEIDEASGYALIEPGVTFFDLYEALRAGGHRYWVSAPALGWGSVVGNALERGLGCHPYADHEANVCGLEVVLPDGELLRTGMGAMEANCAWQLNKAGFGPSADGLFMQSNLGVVTKMGLWLMPQPECFHFCSVRFEHDDDLGPMIEALRPLKIDGTVPCRAIAVNAIRVAQSMSNRLDWGDGRRALSPDAVLELRRKLGVAAWTLVFGVYGHEPVVRAQLKIARAAFEAIPGAEFSATRYDGGATEAEVAVAHLQYAGIPGLDPLKIIGWAGPEGAHLGFSPISPLTAEHALSQARMVRATAERFGFDYGTAFGALGRRLNHVFMMIYNRTDPEETARARACFEALVREGAAAGYGEYRAHISFMDLVAEQYGWGDHAQMRLNRRLKDLLDPNGVLSPGKQGIWPRWRREDPTRTLPPLP
jgi:4-cresol dehydrogenase (hydroxylating)